MAGASRRRQLEELVQESEAFEQELAAWQVADGDAPSQADVHRAQRLYSAWYARAVALVDEADRETFVDMYEGGAFTQRIKSFLGDPVAINPFWSADDEPNPFIGKWAHDFSTTFKPSIAEQRRILVTQIHATSSATSVLDELSDVFRRLPEYLSVLTAAANEHVPAPTIENERDLQVLVHAILRLLYDDVRPEDYVPQRAGAASRVDFWLREAGVVIETKMTRASLSDRRLGEELLIDWGRYQGRTDCEAILAVVYDPERRLSNVAGLEHDLSNDAAAPATRVLVVR